MALAILAALPCLLCAAKAAAQGLLPDYVEALLAKNPVYTGVLRRATRVDAAWGDFDGDGVDEVAVAVRDGPRGGLLLFSSRAGEYVKHFAGLWDDAVPLRVDARGRRLEVLLERQTQRGPRRFRQAVAQVAGWCGPGTGAESEAGRTRPVVEASSTLAARRAEASPEAVFDGSLETGWAEGAPGTGVGERLSVVFPRPLDLAWIGIASGHTTDPQQWKRSNRVHRGVLRLYGGALEAAPGPRAPTPAARPAKGMRRIDFELPDEPGLHYLDVDLRGVERLELEITSVYLGQKYDDAWIAEIDLVCRLPAPKQPVFLLDPLRQRVRR
ncbi:MAG: hypothetical protein D6729_03245 [Deltaproteobacteria bacterium]|nr:MAG: hypothetical protein D6729_03245 [Deltaproteobacteria bacterium]